LSVLAGAAIVALAVWTLRRRHGRGAVQPAAKH
jgi:hypothetical protein